MPKMKTNRASAKRMRRTGRGKIIRNQTNRGHLMTHKSPRRRRRLRSAVIVAPASRHATTALLPYSFKKR